MAIKPLGPSKRNEGRKTVSDYQYLCSLGLEERCQQQNISSVEGNQGITSSNGDMSLWPGVGEPGFCIRMEKIEAEKPIGDYPDVMV